jgi:hypothetical protein
MERGTHTKKAVCNESATCAWYLLLQMQHLLA